MASKTLIDKIEALPPDKRLEVEDFVEFLGLRAAPGPKRAFPGELLRAINDDREELRRTQGLFDTQPIIWEFRDTGGR